MQKLNSRGLLLVEILLAVAVFGMLALIVVSGFVYGRESTSIAGDNSRGAQVANEAVEAVHNIAQGGYTNLGSYVNGTTYYLNTTGSQWSISTTPTTVNGIYTPTIVFAAGPTLKSRQVTVTVTWKANGQRQGKISAVTYLSNWQTATNAGIKTGLLVYANGGTTSNLINYRLLQSNGLWTNPLSLPQAGNSNYVARSVKLYAAQTGATKMTLARFFDGNKQYLYAYYWTGTAWNTPKLLASWTSNGGLDSGNFSGTWLANGTFLATYSDDTYKPKYNTYSAGVWSTQASFAAMSSDTHDSPTSMIVQARPGTNEAMIAMLGDGYETLTAYYSAGAWSAYTVQATTGTSDGTHNVDFAWSSAGSKNQGALVYTRGGSDRAISVRVFTANGTGGGSWGAPMYSATQPSGSIVLSVAIAGQAGSASNFIACDKDTQANQHLYCYTVTANSISTPTNYTVASNTADGGQQTIDLGFELQNGTTGLAAYSDASSSAKLKRWNASTNTWDLNGLGAPNAATTVAKTRLIPEPGLNDAMVLVIDNQNNLYSVMYNGTSSAYYTTPSGYNWTIHNANGPSTAAKWFDFGWDN